MLEALGAVETAAYLPDLQRSDEIDRHPVTIVGKPGVKVTFTIKGLTFRHLEAELVAPYHPLSGDFPVLDTIVTEEDVADVMVTSVCHRIPSARFQS